MKADLIHSWGSDLMVVNNARVSFAKDSQWTYKCRNCGVWDHQPEDGCDQGPCMFVRTLSNADQRLIGYLARGCTLGDWNNMILELTCTGEEDHIVNVLNHVRRMPEHWAPFANGIGMQFHVKAPIPIMRQLFKHKVGSVESEVSRRYVDDGPEVFRPEFRWAPEGSVKQGSGSVMKDLAGAQSRFVYEEAIGYALKAYDELLRIGVCPEQARFVLPQGTYTEARVSNSLYGWANVYNQRHDRKHAQGEIADLADQVAAAAKERFPISWEALTR